MIIFKWIIPPLFFTIANYSSNYFISIFFHLFFQLKLQFYFPISLREYLKLLKVPCLFYHGFHFKVPKIFHLKNIF
jgi:hypothetical protein